MYIPKGYSIDEIFAYAKPVILNIFNSNRNIKTMLYLHCLMASSIQVIPVEFAFHSRDLKLVLEGTDTSKLYDEMADEIEETIENMKDVDGSDWVVVIAKRLVLHTTKWEPIYGSSYIPLDPYIANKKAIINMKNEDDKCFMWCVLRALYPKNDHPERIDKDLKSKQDIINMNGIHYPVS